MTSTQWIVAALAAGFALGSAALGACGSDFVAGVTDDGGSGPGGHSAGGQGTGTVGGGGSGATAAGGTGTVADAGQDALVDCTTCAEWWGTCMAGPIEECKSPTQICIGAERDALEMLRGCVCLTCHGDCDEMCIALPDGGPEPRADMCTACILGVVTNELCTQEIDDCTALSSR